MLAILQSAVAIIVAFGVLIIVHELGHYTVARWCGVKVLRFSVGMGKIIYSRRIGPDQTEWALSVLPLGGYVKMLDAREQDLQNLSAADLAREFTRQMVWRRIAIVAAGPVANFLLAIALFFGLYLHGVPEPIPRLRTVAQQTIAYQAGLRGGELVTAVDGQPIRIWSDLRWKLLQAAVEHGSVRLDADRSAARGHMVVDLPLSSLSTKDLEGDFMGRLGLELARPKAVVGKVAPDGPAMRGGLRAGDLVMAVDGKPIADQTEFRDMVRAAPGRTLQLEVMRAGQNVLLKVTPDAMGENGHAVGLIKVELPVAPEMILADESPVHALEKAVQRTWETSVLQVKMIGKMITGEVSWKNISGPITIADYAGQSARVGAVSYVSFIAFISIILGVMNLLPIPVLDGGLLLYYSLEVLTGRPVSERFNEIAQRAGLAILMTLMIVAVFNDIARHMS
ncbi:MAG: RIP metalloprotease RseP [Burkholderiaceae bacterium]|nr:RIP metalloprotease RseP [Burkholderiaceae bacterium]